MHLCPSAPLLLHTLVQEDDRRKMKATPTLREILEGYRRFNAWELEEQKRELLRLTVEESLVK